MSHRTSPPSRSVPSFVLTLTTPERRVAVLGVESAGDDVGAGDREVGDVGAATEERIGGLDAVELELHLAAAAAAEVQLAALATTPALVATASRRVVDRQLLELLGRASVCLVVDDLVSIRFSARTSISSRVLVTAGGAELEVDGRRLPGVDLHGLHQLAVRHLLDLDRVRADRNAGDDVVALPRPSARRLSPSTTTLA